MSDFENTVHRKMPSDDYQQPHQTLFDIPAGPSNSHKTTGRSGFNPKNVNAFNPKNVNAYEASSQDVSPESDGNLDSSDDVWLTVEEIPLYTEPTSAPPPSSDDKSFERLKPDMLIVLGDVSAKGSELTDSKWLSVLQQFQRIMGPFLGLPLHIVLGNRDVGECCKLNAKSVGQIASSLPGLDSAWRRLLRESLDLRNHVKDTKEAPNEPNEREDDFSNFHWSENFVSSGSGPVLLLQFPLHRTIGSNCDGNDAPSRNHGCFHNKKSRSFANSGFVGTEPYELSHTIPQNATEYIFQAIRPRMIFSAHTHQFCDHIHVDGTDEVTVPAMSWEARNGPAEHYGD